VKPACAQAIVLIAQWNIESAEKSEDIIRSAGPT